VLDEIEYRDKINTMPKSGVYEPLSKDPTAKVERKIQQILAKYKTVFSFEVKRKLTPYHSKPPHLYSLPTTKRQYIYSLIDHSEVAVLFEHNNTGLKKLSSFVCTDK
jgi:hypothetical protein